MKALNIKSAFVGCLAVVALAACGGGGGAGGPITSTLSFPLQSGMRASVANGTSINFAVSGYCSGTDSFTASTPIPGTFENASAVSATITETTDFTNCTPPHSIDNSTDYFDSNKDPLGSIGSSGDYGVYLLPLSIPVSVKVGDAGTIGAKNNYSDNTKGDFTGQDIISYVIEPDTTDTAIVNMIDRSYDSNGTLTSTEQDRSRIMADGTMIPVSADIRDASDSTRHFVFTALPDTTPPTVVSTNPPDNSDSVSGITAITATFSEVIDAATYTTEFTVVNGTTPVAGVVAFSGITATFTPAMPLVSNTTYTATINPGIKDLAGNSMTSKYSWSFTTSYQTPYPFVDVLHTNVVFDSSRGLLYAFVPSSDAKHPNTFAIIDATQRTVEYSPAVDFVPFTMEVSPDGSYLYVGTATTHEVVRLSLPDFAVNMRIDLGTDTAAPAWWPAGQKFDAGHIAISPLDPELFAVPLINNSYYQCATGLRIYKNATMVTQLYNWVDTWVGDIVKFDGTGTQLTTLCSGGYPDIVSRLTFDGSTLTIIDSQRGISGMGNELSVNSSAILTGSGNKFDMPAFTLHGSLPPLTTFSLGDPAPLLQGCVFADDTGGVAACLSQTFEGYPTPRAFVLYELVDANDFLVIPLDLPMSHGTSRIIRTGIGQFAVSVGYSDLNPIWLNQYQYLSQNTRIYFLGGINTTYP